MTACAGCSPIQNQMSDARLPSCLERIVFPYNGYQSASSRISLRPSYQCLACDAIWMFDEQRGYMSQRLRQAA
jgi:hypothetical protein